MAYIQEYVVVCIQGQNQRTYNRIGITFIILPRPCLHRLHVSHADRPLLNSPMSY